VTYTVEFPLGATARNGLSLKDSSGASVPIQLLDAELWPDNSLKKFREDQIQVQIRQRRREAGYFAVLVPRKEGEKAPQFETLSGGRAVRVTFADRVDTIVLQPAGNTLQVDEQTITDSAVVTFRRGNKLELVNLSGK